MACLLFSACRAQPPATAVRLDTPPPRPQLLYVSLANDDTFHKVEIASLASPANGRFVSRLSCLRVYFGGNRGLCLTSELKDEKTVWWAVIVDERFREQGRLPVSGEPSRVRVSPDGRYAAATVFESGHSYADHGFSTRTDIFDLASGQSLGNLEQFTASKDGETVRAADVNYWGVSFARDSDVFYATLATGGVNYLVRGRVSTRTADVIRPGVECPSLSPDNRRIAFKKAVGARSHGWWQIAILDLETSRETLLTRETRSVDDQVEWLDDERVAYHLIATGTAADLWTLRVDDSAAPALLLASAYSPAVLR